jgi:mRNA interferase MazF
MGMVMMIYKPFEVVVVPFPFSDSAETKRRKAFVLSKPPFQEGSRTLVMAMLTSAHASAWPGDVEIVELKPAGLRKSCVARLKLFTLDEALILERVGTISKKDQDAIRAAWSVFLAL